MIYCLSAYFPGGCPAGFSFHTEQLSIVPNRIAPLLVSTGQGAIGTQIKIAFAFN